MRDCPKQRGGRQPTTPPPRLNPWVQYLSRQRSFVSEADSSPEGFGKGDAESGLLPLITEEYRQEKQRAGKDNRQRPTIHHGENTLVTCRGCGTGLHLLLA